MQLVSTGGDQRGAGVQWFSAAPGGPCFNAVGTAGQSRESENPVAYPVTERDRSGRCISSQTRSLSGGSVDPVLPRLERSHNRLLGTKHCRKGTFLVDGIPTSVPGNTFHADDLSEHRSVIRGGSHTSTKRCDSGSTSWPGGVRLLQHLLHSTQEGRGSPAHPQPETLQRLRHQGEVHYVDAPLGDTGVDGQPMADQSGPQRRVFSCPGKTKGQEIPEVQLARTVLRVPDSTVRPVLGATNLHQGSAPSHSMAKVERSSVIRLPGRHPYRRELSPDCNRLCPNDYMGSDQSRIYPQHKEIRTHPHSGPSVHWGSIPDKSGDGVSPGRPSPGSATVCSDLPPGRRIPNCPPVVATSRSHGLHNPCGGVRPPSHASDSVAPEGEVDCPARSETSGNGVQDSGEGSPMVDEGGKPDTGITSFSASSFIHGDHGCEHGRMGRPHESGFPEPSLSRDLGRVGGTVSHQYVGTTSYQAHPSTRGTVSPRSVSNDRMRQHDSGGLREQGGRYNLQFSQPRDDLVIRVGHQPQGETQSNPSTGSGQCPRRLPLKESGRPSRMAPESGDSPQALRDMGTTPDRCVRFTHQLSPSPVVQSMASSRGRGHQRLSPTLGRAQSVRLSPDPPDPPNPREDQRGQSRTGGGRSPHMAEETMVQPLVGVGNRDSTVTSTEVRPVVSAPPREERHPVPFEPAVFKLSGLEAERRALQAQGLAPDVITTTLAHKRASTRRIEDSHWRIFCTWCQTKDISDPISASVVEILNFLQEKSVDLVPGTIFGYVTAITARHELIQGVKLSAVPLIVNWKRGLQQQVGVTRVIVAPWCLEVVLSALKKPPYEPMCGEGVDLKFLTLKTVFLTAFACARRASEIHAFECNEPYLSFTADGVRLYTKLGFRHKIETKAISNRPICLPSLESETDPGLRLLCVRRAIKFYLMYLRNHGFRKSGHTQLFLTYGGTDKGHPVSKIRISEWLKMTIHLAYQGAGLDTPVGVKGHQLRKQSVSIAEMTGISPQEICDAATWSSTNMFVRRYQLDVVARQDYRMGRHVIRDRGTSPSVPRTSGRVRPHSKAHRKK